MSCIFFKFQIELANFELFSSCPKEFAVYSSDNFPTRDWVRLGTFTAVEQRVLQSFELKQEGFGKFIKVYCYSKFNLLQSCFSFFFKANLKFLFIF